MSQLPRVPNVCGGVGKRGKSEHRTSPNESQRVPTSPKVAKGPSASAFGWSQGVPVSRRAPALAKLGSRNSFQINTRPQRQRLGVVPRRPNIAQAPSASISGVPPSPRAPAPAYPGSPDESQHRTGPQRQSWPGGLAECLLLLSLLLLLLL